MARRVKLEGYQPARRRPVAAESAGTMASASEVLKMAKTLKGLKGVGKKK